MEPPTYDKVAPRHTAASQDACEDTGSSLVIPTPCMTSSFEGRRAPKCTLLSELRLDSSDDEDERKTLSDGAMEEVKAEVRTKDAYRLEETESRNVIMVGRTRSGKSTAIGVIKDPCCPPKPMSIFSDTVDPKYQSFALRVYGPTGEGGDTKKYTLGIIDTPGLFEVKSQGGTVRDNTVIVRTISKCLEHEVTSVNTVMVFCSFETGINPNDIEAIDTFLSLFAGEGVNIALCVTRSERHSTAWQASLKQQLLEHPRLSELISEKNIEIIFMGCVDVQSLRVTDTAELFKAYKKVYKLREKLLKYIFSSTTKASLTSLPVLKNAILSMQTLAKEIIGHLEYFLTVKDFALGSVQHRIAIHDSNMQELLGNQAMFSTSPEMMAVVETLMRTAREVNNQLEIPIDVKTKILHYFTLPPPSDARSAAPEPSVPSPKRKKKGYQKPSSIPELRQK